VPCFFISRSLGIYAFFMQNLPYTDDKCSIIDIVICQVHVIERMESFRARLACKHWRSRKRTNHDESTFPS
jgi:hypothetical protein